MRVLVGCEFSGVVRDAFIGFGHDAVSCDILPTERPGPHIQADVRTVMNDGWDLGIFHPPCTYLTNAGARWLYWDGRNGRKAEQRWAQMKEAAQFFNDLAGANIPRLALENPIMHGHALELVGRKHDQIVHPWWFGHGETKATCLWLKNLPEIVPTNVVEGRRPVVHFEAPGPDRWKRRSRTKEGLAYAMASQWGSVPTSSAESAK